MALKMILFGTLLERICFFKKGCLWEWRSEADSGGESALMFNFLGLQE
jgi:hypothetical protein